MGRIVLAWVLLLAGVPSCAEPCTCTDEVVDAYSVTLRVASGSLPADLTITVSLSTRPGFTGEEAIQEPGLHCAPPVDASGAPRKDALRCDWGPRAEGTSTLVAKASGYLPVQMTLTAEYDDCGCHPQTQVRDVVLTPG